MNKVMNTIFLNEDIDEVLGLYGTCLTMIKQAEKVQGMPVDIYKSIMKQIEPQCMKYINDTADPEVKDWPTFIKKVNAAIDLQIAKMLG